MAKLTLTNVTRTQRTSRRTGKDYTSLSLKSVEYGERFINGFGNKDNMAWKSGDIVDLEIKEVEKDGKKYLNFEMPERAKGGGTFTEADRNTLIRLEIAVEQIKSGLSKLLSIGDVSLEDMPFEPTEEPPF